jgi:hypothetical protein
MSGFFFDILNCEVARFKVAELQSCKGFEFLRFKANRLKIRGNPLHPRHPRANSQSCKDS